MKIFISYGHNEYPQFMEYLAEDLREEHKVWIDTEIRLGDNWSAEIDRAMRDCDLFLFIKTARSVDPDSYCRGEISFAQEHGKRIVVISLDDAETPSIIASSHRIFMENSIGLIGEVDEEEYNRDIIRLREELNRITEEKPQVRKGGLFTFPEDNISYEPAQGAFIPKEIHRLINEWLASEKRFLGVFGAAGSGKSTISRILYHEADCAVIHFFNYNDIRTIDPKYYLQHIITCLKEVSPEFAENLQKTNFDIDFNMIRVNHLFEEYLIKPLQGVHHQVVLILDAFDEIADKGKRKETAELLLGDGSPLQRLGNNIKVMITSRNDAALANLLAARGAELIRNCEKKTRDAVENVVKQYLEVNDMEYDEGILSKIIRQSDGDFLYIQFILDELKRMRPSDFKTIRFPIGMKGVCQKQFDRIFEDEDDFNDVAEPVLEILISVKTPIHTEELIAMCDVSRRDLRSLLKKMEMFVDVRNEKITFVHKSLYDWLISNEIMDKYYVDCRGGQDRICEYVLEQLQQETPSEYAANYGLAHLVEADRFDKIGELIGQHERSFDSIFLSFVDSMIYEDNSTVMLQIFRKALRMQKQDLFLTSETLKKLIQYEKNKTADQIIRLFHDSDDFALYGDLAEFYSLRRDNRSVLEYKKLGEQLIEEIPDQRLLADVLRVIADANRENGDYDLAEEQYRRVLEIAQQEFLNSIQYDCLFALIDLLYVRGKLRDAWAELETIRDSLDFEVPNMQVYKYQGLVGHLYFAVEDRKNARPAYLESLNIARDLNYPLKKMEAANNVAESSDNYSSGIPFLGISRDIFENFGLNKLEYGKSFYIEADLLFHDGEYEQAISPAAESISILESVGYAGGQAHAHLVKGKAEYETGRYAEAIEDLKSANDHYREMNIRPGFRLETLAYMLMSAEKIGNLPLYLNYDSLDSFNPDEYPTLNGLYEYVRTKLKSISD